MGGLGGFGALCALPTKYKEPILFLAQMALAQNYVLRD